MCCEMCADIKVLLCDGRTCNWLLCLVENNEISVPKYSMIQWCVVMSFVRLLCVFLQGHSPAGGCLLALSCEYRVMVGPKYTIGLNESRVGIVAPKW